MNRPRPLLPLVGAGFGIAVTVGSMVGAGLVRAPGEIAAYFPAVGPFLGIWAAGALYALLGTNAVAELAAMQPRSGGAFVHVRDALGDYAGFVTGWAEWLAFSGATALVAMILGEAVVALLPATRAPEVVALAAVALATVVQWLGLRAAAHAQIAATALKLLGVVIIIGACLVGGARNPVGAAIETAEEGSLLLGAVFAAQVVVFAYAGWGAIACFAGAIRDAERVLPKTAFAATAAAAAIYLGVNAAFLRVVPVATISGERFAAAAVAQFVFGPRASIGAYAIALVILGSALHANLMAAPRIVHSMAGEGLLWRHAGEISSGGTPDVALLFSSGVVAALIVLGRFGSAIANIAFLVVARDAVVFVSLFVLRSRGSAAPRPWRSIGHPVTTGVALAAAIGFLLVSDAVDAGSAAWAVGLLVLSVPGYLLLKPKAISAA